MINKNSKYLFVFIFFVCILSISAISATENTTDKEVIKTSNNKESNLETINYQDDDVSNSNENVELKEKETVNEDRYGKSGTDKTTAENEDPLTFSDLNYAINGNTDSTIYLSHNYEYDSVIDSRFTNGITISRNLNIYGNGVTIDGNNMARIFYVTDSNVNFYNINFINGRSGTGGAIYSGNAYNCNFTNNFATDLDYKGGGAIAYGSAYNCTFTENGCEDMGGAINHGTAINCTFIRNKAGFGGGAVYSSNAFNCIFTGNSAQHGGGGVFWSKYGLCRFTTESDEVYESTLVTPVINVLNYTSTYKSGKRFQFNVTCDGMLFDGVNITINVYNIDITVRTIYCLSGDSIILDDLPPLIYDVMLRFTDFPEYSPVEAIINVLKLNTNVVINPIGDVKVGQDVIINYTTNSNSTVIIKVNGTTVTDGKFTPTIGGIYNVTVEVADSTYYTKGYNETIFTVEKTNSTVIINPISTVIRGQEVIINYTTNSNGTVIIKVNGTRLTDGKFTPTTAGVYNVTVEVAENDYYNAAVNETLFTVEKLASIITATSVSTTYNVGKNLVITLKDCNGEAIKNAVLTVNLGGAKKHKNTDKNGQIKINVATLTPKTYNAKITYAGSNNYNASTSSVKITVKKATPKIAAKSASYNLKLKTKKYPVIIKTNKNKALKNTKVTLKVNGKTFNVKTNSKGLGVFKITNLKKKGIYIAVITVPTNKYYNKISKKMKIAVKS